jgi:protein-S-isoprenylcysteine O-methyltransferase Ste14
VAAVLDHHAAGWIALALGLAAVGIGAFGRARVLRVAPERRTPRTTGRAGWWARGLYGLSTVLGLAAPLLVGADVVDPIALFDDPGVVVVGVGLMLLGVVLVLASQAQIASVRAGTPDPVLATGGLRSRVRHPGLTGLVVVTAGTLLMVPTLIAVLAAVLLVVAVQIQVRGVREPMLARLHGETYADYAARTGRFLPRMRHTEHDEAAPGISDPQHTRVA